MKISRATNGRTMAYTYDLVGNVTQVSSICPWLQNQSFTENFSYDSTDQLISANEAQSYQLAVNYGNWGKIMQYDLTQTDMLNNATSQISRSLTYPSHAHNVGNSQTPFAPTMQNGDEDVFFTFGINGSLRKKETTQPQQHTEYYLFNSQGNLKAYSDDVMSFAYYGYNAANTRTYKISLYNTNLWINGQQQPLHLQLQQAMFYPNTYLNFDAFGNYTKHYYNGMERVASRLGDNTTTISLNNNILEDRKLQVEEQFRVDIHKLIYETVLIDLPPFMDVNALQPTDTPNDIYYYHPNHLGSTSFVTDQNQTITQGFLYAPFGEITTEYNINFGNNTIPKYSFNAKELDEETGMYYYEARYYAPPVFTSRDLMFEKYFWMSPYAYCANNPIKYVDPSGEEIDIALEIRQDKDKPVGQVVVYKNGQLYNKNADGTIGKLYTGDSEYARLVQAHLNELIGKDKELANVISDLEKLDGNIHTISMIKSSIKDNDVGPGITTTIYGNGCTPLNKESEKAGKPTGSNINYNPYNDNSWQNDPNKIRPAIIGLAHELGHAFHFTKGDVILNEEKSEPDFSAFENQARKIENIARKAYNLSPRPYYK